MRLYPNCYYRKEIIRKCDGSCGGHINGHGCYGTGPSRFKQLSTSHAQDMRLMNADILRHDPFQHPHHED